MIKKLVILTIFMISLSGNAQNKVTDNDQVKAAIENYFYGYIERDSDRLRKAFDTDNGFMKRHSTGKNGKERVENIPFSELVPKWGSREKLPATELKQCALEIENMDVVDGTIASARISMKVVDVTYIDILSLQKINGQWKIVNKIFTVAEQ